MLAKFYISESLLNIAPYCNSAFFEIWTSISNPENVPIFLSSLVKSSAGPTLAFALSLLAFRLQENKRQEKESESTRSLLAMEIDYNFSRVEKLIKNYDKMSETLTQPGKHNFAFAPHGIETQVFNALTGKLFQR